MFGRRHRSDSFKTGKFKMTKRVSVTTVKFLAFIFFLSLFFNGKGQVTGNDTLIIPPDKNKYDQFYDSLANRARQKKITSFFYDALISRPGPYIDRKTLSLEYYKKSEGKIIAGISITPLEVFGPTFEDTTRQARSVVEKLANSIHTKSNLNTIKNMLLFKVGDFLDPEILYESERLIRNLPYIHDIRFIIKQDSTFQGIVDIHILTKDRFSLGASGGVEGSSSADLELYNQNIFGVGHEISFRFVGHINRQPYMGLETWYNINNISGKFINITAGYSNTYRQEGFSLMFDKPFITPSLKWGYGLSGSRYFRSDRLYENDPIEYPLPINILNLSGWTGHSFQIKPDNPKNSQMVIATAFYNRKFYDQPIPPPGESRYFSNGTFLLTGLTFTQRRYIQDKLVYSYGITEDIPEGFKNELVYGYDFNEFGNRHYAHIYLSNGNLLVNSQSYLHLAGAIGGYLKNMQIEQGQIQASLNYISRQIYAGRQRLRLFLRTNYMLGIRRFEIETLNLNRDEHIRGFTSKEAVGKQRLSVDLEYVLFLRREIYKFNMALFGFADIGIIGSNRNFILYENYYTGIGLGMRLHNENLVFKTFQIRLALYPLHPSDMSFAGFIVQERLKKDFYTFQPFAPQPLRFQ